MAIEAPSMGHGVVVFSQPRLPRTEGRCCKVALPGAVSWPGFVVGFVPNFSRAGSCTRSRPQSTILSGTGACTDRNGVRNLAHCLRSFPQRHFLAARGRCCRCCRVPAGHPLLRGTTAGSSILVAIRDIGRCHPRRPLSARLLEKEFPADAPPAGCPFCPLGLGDGTKLVLARASDSRLWCNPDVGHLPSTFSGSEGQRFSRPQVDRCFC